jgi:hypothetical protein
VPDHGIEVRPLKDLPEKMPPRHEQLPGESQGALEEEGGAGAVCGTDAGGGRGQITEHHVEGGGKSVKVGGLQLKDINPEHMNVGRQFQRHRVSVHPHYETALADGASTIQQP